MKFKITLKDPDVLYEAIKEAVDTLKIDGVDEDEIETIKEKRQEKIYEQCGQWFEYGEYLTVEVDTEAGTCVVVPVDNQ